MDSRSYQPITNGEPQITELIKPAKVDERMNRLSACSSKEKLFNHRLQILVQRKSKMNCHSINPNSHAGALST